MNLIVEFSKQFLWLFFHFVFIRIRWISWNLTGVSSHLTEIQREGSYKKSLHMRRIWLKYNMEPIEVPNSENSFMAVHESFQDPEYVLKDSVTLFTVNNKEASFVENDSKEDVFNSDNGAFAKIAQHRLAERYLVMPLSCLHQLADSLPDVGDRVVFISNTARCGSTLMTQVFEQTGRCVAWSEPDALNAITQLKPGTSKAETDQIFRSTIKLLCKPRSGRPVDAYILKIMPPSMISIPRLHRLYPRAKQIFMYRDALPVIRSYNRVGHVGPIVDLLIRLGKYSASVTALGMKAMGLPDEKFKERLQSRSHFSTLVWASGVSLYLDFQRQGVTIKAVKYEDLVSHTTFAMKQIFQHIGLAFDGPAQEAINRAFSRDSQRGTILSQQSLSTVQPEVIDERIMGNINSVCHKFGLPPVTESLTLPGTITTMPD